MLGELFPNIYASATGNQPGCGSSHEAKNLSRRRPAVRPGRGNLQSGAPVSEHWRHLLRSTATVRAVEVSTGREMNKLGHCLKNGGRR